ncbi:SHOCT domain-containing protein [Rhizobium sp. L1K21]|uniref:SHOCT domain-containing protein n=1 Tax=Rhizobium sp. L1K21 TaxID=2954933 RepID=UPI0020935FA7|nr:SHOCT domain-containing protein [Rhizobium sp. L1K21]MCO6185949.1 SHOCT domain-containing protein [Rhizobium sp. L1K21]
MFGRLSCVMSSLALTLGLLAGCTSTEDVLGTATTGVDGNTVRMTGTYPSLGDPLEAANAQLSDEEAAALGGKLEALASARQGLTTSNADYQKRAAALKKLGQEHGAAAANDIEN